MPQLNFIYYPIVIFWSLLLFFSFYFIFSYFILFFFCRDYKYSGYRAILLIYIKKLNIFLHKIIKLIFCTINIIYCLYLKSFFLKFQFLKLNVLIYNYVSIILSYLNVFYSYSYYKYFLEKNIKKVGVVFNSVILLDLPYKGQYLFQDPATPIMEGIINFHHDLLFIQIFIATFVVWMLSRILIKFRRISSRESNYFVNPEKFKKDNEYLFDFTDSSISFKYKYLYFKYLYFCCRLMGYGDFTTTSVMPCKVTGETINFSLYDLNVEFETLALVWQEGYNTFFSCQGVSISHIEWTKRTLHEQGAPLFADANKIFTEMGIFYDSKFHYVRDFKYALSPISAKYDLGYNNKIPSQLVHHTLLEIVWTVIPSFILIYIAIPSFALLYAMDELIAPVITIKIIGNQWYWRYELSVIKDNHYFFTDYNNFSYLKDKLNIISYTEESNFESNLNIFVNEITDHTVDVCKFSLLYHSYSELFKFYEDLTFNGLYSPFNINLFGASILKQKKKLLSIFTKYFIFSDIGLSQASLNNLIFTYANDNVEPSILHLLLDKLFLSKLYFDNSLSDLVNKQGKITYESRLIGIENKDYYIVPNKVGLYRLLDTDNALILPEKLSIRLLITASDVLHSWAVPSFGVKLDACPGRLNQTGLFLKRIGTFYGQCSEICGINHAFMPIVVKGVSYESYDLYKLSFLLKSLNKFFHF